MNDTASPLKLNRRKKISYTTYLQDKRTMSVNNFDASSSDESTCKYRTEICVSKIRALLDRTSVHLLIAMYWGNSYPVRSHNETGRTKFIP